MTKVEAISCVMNDNGGVTTLEIIYSEIEKYYPEAKRSKDWQAGIRGVLYRDLGKRFKRIDTSTYALINYDERLLLPKEYQDKTTDKEILKTVRVLQQKFRSELLKSLKFCPITLISDKRLLVASHIKPWCLSTSDEKLDINNGFILSPVYDKLFDTGLITITHKKELLISSTLSRDTRSKLGLNEGIYERLPIKMRENFLQFHNEKIFIP